MTWRGPLALLGIVAALAGLFVFGRVQGGFFPWFLFYFCIVLGAYEACTWAFCLRGVTVARTLSGTRLAQGQSLTVEVTLVRHGGWPLFWVEVDDQLPASWRIDDASGRRRLIPLWSETVHYRYVVPSPARGLYRIGPTAVASGDLLGLICRRKVFPQQHEVLVYPQVLPVRGWMGSRAEELGLKQATRQRSDDSTTVLGVRDYAPGDRLSRIHWPASARRGLLQAKEFERHVSDDMLFLVDLARSSYSGDEGEARFELAMVVAASLLKHAYDLRRNFSWAMHGARLVKFPGGSDEALFLRCLESLAMAQADGPVAFSHTLRHVSQEVTQGSLLVVISPFLTPETAAAAATLRGRVAVEWFAPLARTSLLANEQQGLTMLQKAGVRVHLLASAEQLQRLGRGGGERATGF
jgi:uncharacterized protein (DUF58 family)